MCDGFQPDNDLTESPFYAEMNDSSIHRIKKCQSLYSAENEVKMGFVQLLINMYDGTTTLQGHESLFVYYCQSFLMILPFLYLLVAALWGASFKGKESRRRIEVKQQSKNDSLLI